MALLSSSAFALTGEEKEECTREIVSCVIRCAAVVNRREPPCALSAADCGEALSHLRSALTLAYDEDACDCVPWSQAHLYLGHIMRALRRLPEAEDAYAEAAGIGAGAAARGDFSEEAASKEAAACLLYLDERKRVDRRMGGVWERYRLGPLHGGEDDSDDDVVKRRARRLRDRLNSAAAWDPEHHVVVQPAAATAKKPCIVTPGPDALPHPAGGRAEIKDAARLGLKAD